MSKQLSPVSINSNGITKDYPVDNLNNASGYADGMYQVEFVNHVKQHAIILVAVVGETIVAKTGLTGSIESQSEDFKTRVLISQEHGPLTEAGSHLTRKLVGVYAIPDSASRAIEMGRSCGITFA